MSHFSNLTPEELEEIDQRIDHFFGFVRDILDEPSVLDRLPQEASIDLTPIENKQPGKTYLGETRHYAVSEARIRMRENDDLALNPRKHSA